MPRIRSIKPEFWTSGQIIECSTNARLLFIGLWNFCDDAGRHPFRPKQIKAEIFPADDFTPDDIRRLLDELSSNGLVMLYEHDNQQFLQVKGWHHQRIDRPQKPKYPDPFDEHSTIVRGSFVPDRIGGDRIGGDRIGGDRASGADAPQSPRGDKKQPQKPDWLDTEVWNEYRRFRTSKKATLTPLAWGKIVKELEKGIAAGHDPNDMLTEAMAAGWQGFKFDWYLNRAGGGASGKSVAQKAVEYREQRRSILTES